MGGVQNRFGEGFYGIFSSYGAEFYTPPTPENTLLGGGAYKRGGGIKFLPRGGSEYTPPPLPEKCLLARMGGGGGGVYNFSLETGSRYRGVSQLQPHTSRATLCN